MRLCYLSFFFFSFFWVDKFTILLLLLLLLFCVEKIVSIGYQYKVIFLIFLKKKKKEVIFLMGPTNHCWVTIAHMTFCVLFAKRMDIFDSVYIYRCIKKSNNLVGKIMMILLYALKERELWLWMTTNDGLRLKTTSK